MWPRSPWFAWSDVFEPYALAFGPGAHRHALDAAAAKFDLPVRIEAAEMLLVAGAGTSFLKGDHSILVGQIFNAAGKRLETLPVEFESWSTLAEASVFPPGIWGNFAHFSGPAELASVYRDPSGSVPVYRIGDCSEAVFVSGAEFAGKLKLLERAEFDEHFIVHWLQFPFLRTGRTGIEGVTELLPGMVFRSSGRGRWRQSSGWHPSAFVVKQIQDPAEGARRLQAIALGIVGIQPGATKIALRLSGGLDSSIIAACLAEAKREFCCINFATRSRDGDERGHAREVARTFGANLVEVGEPEAGALEVPDRLSFRPLMNPLLSPFEKAIGEAAGDLGASLLVDGAGGDNLFCSLSSAAPLIDALRSLRPSNVRAALGDIASRANCTLWEVIFAATRRLAKGRPAWKEDRSFMVSEALLARPDLHPWLVDLPAPPGKREHIEAIVHIQHFLDRSASSIERIHPLLAQPLLELCLQIPSWLWLAGGRDRAVAREAFKGLVPASVLERRIKGSLQGMLYRGFSALREPMRELLVEGELAKLQIVDAAAIEDALNGEVWMCDQVQLRISEMAALELWIRSWRSRGTTAHNLSEL
jgi:asparagine synthase (glutamine-hydrolysing)